MAVALASAAVAAQCGHAVQHAAAMPPQLRSKLVPAMQFSSSIVNLVLLVGIFMACSGNPTVLLIGIILMG